MVAADFPVGRDELGRKLCRFCKKPIPKGRRTLCSDECGEQILIRTHPQTARAKVFKRDKGICAECGRDTEREREHLYKRYAYIGNIPYGERTLEQETERRRLHRIIYEHAWEMDHIVPVIEGGGGCGLENLRTLCLDCHKKATAELARRRAEQRRPPKPKSPQIALFDSLICQ